MMCCVHSPSKVEQMLSGSTVPARALFISTEGKLLYCGCVLFQ